VKLVGNIKNTKWTVTRARITQTRDFR